MGHDTRNYCLWNIIYRSRFFDQKVLLEIEEEKGLW